MISLYFLLHDPRLDEIHKYDVFARRWRGFGGWANIRGRPLLDALNEGGFRSSEEIWGRIVTA